MGTKTNTNSSTANWGTPNFDGLKKILEQSEHGLNTQLEYYKDLKRKLENERSKLEKG